VTATAEILEHGGIALLTELSKSQDFDIKREATEALAALTTDQSLYQSCYVDF
jgi:hypothetical protein